MTEPFYVYIAAPITGLPSEYLANVVAISRLSRELMEDHYCPINPAADFLEGLMSPHPIALDLYHGRALDLLRLLEGRPRAALYVMRTTRADGSRATGVIREIECAHEWGIQVVSTRTELDRLRDASPPGQERHEYQPTPSSAEPHDLVIPGGRGAPELPDGQGPHDRTGEAKHV